MADFATSSPPYPSSPGKPKKPPSSFLFGFTSFASKAFSDTESVMSPTSILDTKPFSAFKNPFWSESNTQKPSSTDLNFDTKPRIACPKFVTEGIGLGIIDSLTADSKKKLTVAKKPGNSKLVLFGSQLKIQIPTPYNASFAMDSPKSSMEFGIKTKNSQMGLLSPSNCAVKCSLGSSLGPVTFGSPRIFNGSLSSAEMELSEDYTCVIAREGPVTKTTRIFDDCIVDSCFGNPGVSSSSCERKDENRISVSPDGPIGYHYPSDSFLSFCHTCKKNLAHGNDIYIYRGEKAFCSDDCRHQEMLMEERLEKHGTPGVDCFGSW